VALSRDAYQALEDIVGPDNVSEEPAVLDSYAFQQGADISFESGSHFCHRPAAVIMPASAAEVQAIVRTCNRYKIKCKPYSTGWGAASAPTVKDEIQMDLRRMNRILEIDEKNMFAVVEPYVVGVQLQAELMKIGLNCHMIGAGGSCSILATSTSFVGPGPDSIFMGYSSENLLALEWVMPTGDILRTGSLGSRLGWFCGDGPGPSVRGIVRGSVGAVGGLGIFTKCATKIYPWHGPPVIPVEGTVPSYNSPLPENIRAYTLAFPTWDTYCDAHYKIYDAEIGYIVHRQFNMFGEDLQAAMIKILTDPMKTLDDIEELLKDPEVQRLTEEMRYSFQIVLAGNSVKDIEYQEKALSEILARTGGRKVAAMADPAVMKWVLLYLIKLCFKNLNFTYVGGYTGTYGNKGSPDFGARTAERCSRDQKKRYIEEGVLADDGGDASMGAISSIGGGGVCGLEQFCFYDSADPESTKGMRRFLAEADRLRSERGWPVGLEYIEGTMARGIRPLRISGMPQPAACQWQMKIKQAFDPQDVGDDGYSYRWVE
jgi:glycolate oxidase